MKELRVQSVSKKVMLAAGLVIQSLDEKGFFAAALEDIGVDYGLSVADMEAGLRLVQTFDPPGVGARTIQEALLIQTRRRKDAPAGAEELLMNHYDDFIRGHWKRLEEQMGLSPEGLGRIRHFLKKLALQPAAPADERTEFVRADIEILCDEEGHLTVRSLEDLPDVFSATICIRLMVRTAIRRRRFLSARPSGSFWIYRQPWRTAVSQFLQSWSI